MLDLCHLFLLFATNPTAYYILNINFIINFVGLHRLLYYYQVTINHTYKSKTYKDTKQTNKMNNQNSKSMIRTSHGNL